MKKKNYSIDKLKRNKLFLFASGIMILTSPFSGSLFDSPVWCNPILWRSFILIKGSINEANLIQKGIWIFNRETIKEYFQHKRKNRFV